MKGEKWTKRKWEIEKWKIRSWTIRELKEKSAKEEIKWRKPEEWRIEKRKVGNEKKD